MTKTYRSILALAAALGLTLGVVSPAAASGSYGGSGSVSITTYNFWRTIFLPSPPSSVPQDTTVTSVSYTLHDTNPRFAPGFLETRICSTTTHCVDITRFGGTTSFFNGLPARTNLSIHTRYRHAWLTGLIDGSVNVSASLTVHYE